MYESINPQDISDPTLQSHSVTIPGGCFGKGPGRILWLFKILLMTEF